MSIYCLVVSKEAWDAYCEYCETHANATIIGENQYGERIEERAYLPSLDESKTEKGLS